jgi:zinc transport system permease protein
MGMLTFIIYIFSYSFLLYAILALTGTSVLAATVGTYVTINRFSYIAGALSHSILFGMGLFTYLKAIFISNKFLSEILFAPLNGAFLSGILFSFIIAYLYNNKKERLDTILSAIWSIGMSAGILFIFLTPGYNQELTRYLFGNILLVSLKDIVILFIFAFFIVAIFSLFYKKILSIGFDNEFALIMGQNVKLFNILFILITSFTVVLLTQIVGIVLLIALLTLPSSTILKFNLSLRKTMLLSGLLTFIVGFFGLYFSFNFNLPASPIIILLLGAIYIFVFILKSNLKGSFVNLFNILFKKNLK